MLRHLCVHLVPLSLLLVYEVVCQLHMRAMLAPLPVALDLFALTFEFLAGGHITRLVAAELKEDARRRATAISNGTDPIIFNQRTLTISHGHLKSMSL